ncbi:transglycosylase SLT domain-containing protein [Sinorhizobium sp. CB9]
MAVATVAPPTSPLPAIDQQTGETLAAVAVPMPNPSRQELVAAAAPAVNAVAAPMMPAVASPAQLAAGAPATVATTAYAPIPLTPEMTAIQAVVPTPRPGTPAQPTIQLAYAGTPQLSTAALSAMDAAPAMMDFRFDESGPTEVPAALDDADDDTSGPTVEKSYISKLISKYAKLYEVPESLLHRVVHRESRYNPGAYNKRGYFGLMQIRYNTAKSMGYDGPANGLFDAETNIKYAAKYLRGAWVVADNKEDDAVRLYARGYYYDAKRKGMSDIANGNY